MPSRVWNVEGSWVCFPAVAATALEPPALFVDACPRGGPVFTISVGKLRQNPSQMLREVPEGARHTVTDRGRPVAQVGPVHGARWVPTACPRSGVRGGGVQNDAREEALTQFAVLRVRVRRSAGSFAAHRATSNFRHRRSPRRAAGSCRRGAYEVSSG